MLTSTRTLPSPLSSTPLSVVIASTSTSGRYVWQLQTVRGHFCVVTSGTAYLTRRSAKLGARRFLTAYFARPESVTWA